MNPQERLAIAATALAEYNPDHIDAIEDVSPEELAKISADFDLKVDKLPRLIGIMIYIRKRLVEKMGRVKSFQAAFPERCVATDNNAVLVEYGATAEVGEPLHNTTIDVKAKRLENSQLYIHVYQLLQSNLYINYAVDRMRVLDEALNISLDPLTSHRDKYNYMKIFLDETRKPENAKELEFNLNITNNDVSVISVEEKLTSIAATVKDMGAAQLVELLHQGKSDDTRED